MGHHQPAFTRAAADLRIRDTVTVAHWLKQGVEVSLGLCEENAHQGGTTRYLEATTYQKSIGQFLISAGRNHGANSILRTAWNACGVYDQKLLDFMQKSGPFSPFPKEISLSGKQYRGITCIDWNGVLATLGYAERIIPLLHDQRFPQHDKAEAAQLLLTSQIRPLAPLLRPKYPVTDLVQIAGL